MGDPQDRLIDLDQLLHKVGFAALTPLANQDTTGNAQVPIKPAMPDAAAVRLDADLQVPVGGALADGLDSEAGRIGMRADHADGVTRLPALADGEGDDRRSVACQIVLPAGLNRGCPVVALLDLGEAGGIEERRSAGGRVVGWGIVSRDF